MVRVFCFLQLLAVSSTDTRLGGDQSAEETAMLQQRKTSSINRGTMNVEETLEQMEDALSGKTKKERHACVTDCSQDSDECMVSFTGQTCEKQKRWCSHPKKKWNVLACCPNTCKEDGATIDDAICEQKGSCAKSKEPCEDCTQDSDYCLMHNLGNEWRCKDHADKCNDRRNCGKVMRQCCQATCAQVLEAADLAKLWCNRNVTTTTSTTTTTTSTTTTTTPRIITEKRTATTTTSAAETTSFVHPAFTTTLPFKGEIGHCRIWGDPHVTTFDGFHTTDLQDTGNLDSYKHGDFWLVRTADIQIHGRYWSDHGSEKTSLRALAVSGAALHYQTLTIEPLGWWGMKGKISWRGRALTSTAMLSTAQREGSFTASGGLESGAITLSFAKKGLVLKVSRGANYLDVDIEMPRQRGGQAGHCGNFNGKRGDDQAELEGGKNLVAEQETLFVIPHYAGTRCSSKLRWTQLVAVTGNGHERVDACAKACQAHNGVSAWTHFGVTAGMCHCASAKVDHGSTSWSSKCYSYEFKDDVKSMAGCAQDKQKSARKFCAERMPQASASEVDACVFDSCFATPALVEGDIEFTKQVHDATAPSPTPVPSPSPAPTPPAETCKGVRQNQRGVTAEHCKKCKEGYKWWPCDKPELRALCCA